MTRARIRREADALAGLGAVLGIAESAVLPAGWPLRLGLGNAAVVVAARRFGRDRGGATAVGRVALVRAVLVALGRGSILSPTFLFSVASALASAVATVALERSSGGRILPATLGAAGAAAAGLAQVGLFAALTGAWALAAPLGAAAVAWGMLVGGAVGAAAGRIDAAWRAAEVGTTSGGSGWAGPASAGSGSAGAGATAAVAAAASLALAVSGCAAPPPATPPAEPEPELAALMGEMARMSHKLGLAIEAENAPLASFYLHEVEEAMAEVEKIDEHDGIPIGSTLRTILRPAVDELEGRLEAGDWPKTREGYAGVVEACNRCHAATGHEFVVIALPAGPPPFNQDFRPRAGDRSPGPTPRP